jgi:hypothetical protein
MTPMTNNVLYIATSLTIIVSILCYTCAKNLKKQQGTDWLLLTMAFAGFSIMGWGSVLINVGYKLIYGF